MSFLAEIQSKRLRPTTTNIQYPDGRRYCLQNGVEQKSDADDGAGFVVDTKPDREVACILPSFLYLGSQDAVDDQNVDKHKITHILSIGIKVPPVADVRTSFIECLDLPDAQLTGEVLDESNRFLEEVAKSGGRVLVHCNAGVSRSAAVVIGYLIVHKRMSYAEAIDLVRLKRPCCRPNDGFVKQLKNLCREIKIE